MDPKDQNKSKNTEAAKNSTAGNAQQEKLKKAHEQNARDEEIKKMSPKGLHFSFGEVFDRRSKLYYGSSRASN